jgi:ribosomal protein L32
MTSSGPSPASVHAWPLRNLLSASITIPAITINIPGLVSDIWEGILRAVPKKKTSHMKKRHRQLAGKALKDVKAINICPGCGKPKKAHTLCPYCVAGTFVPSYVAKQG